MLGLKLNHVSTNTPLVTMSAVEIVKQPQWPCRDYRFLLLLQSAVFEFFITIVITWHSYNWCTFVFAPLFPYNGVCHVTGALGQLFLFWFLSTVWDSTYLTSYQTLVSLCQGSFKNKNHHTPSTFPGQRTLLIFASCEVFSSGLA